MAESNITEVLLASLRREGDRYARELRDIEVALAALELPRAFRLMSALKDRGVWQPTPAEAEALEDFWWEYGQ
jgi:hypothetical protein